MICIYYMTFIKFSYNFNMGFVKQSSNNLFTANNKNTTKRSHIVSLSLFADFEQVVVEHLVGIL